MGWALVDNCFLCFIMTAIMQNFLYFSKRAEKKDSESEFLIMTKNHRLNKSNLIKHVYRMNCESYVFPTLARHLRVCDAGLRYSGTYLTTLQLSANHQNRDRI